MADLKGGSGQWIGSTELRGDLRLAAVIRSAGKIGTSREGPLDSRKCERNLRRHDPDPDTRNPGLGDFRDLAPFPALGDGAFRTTEPSGVDNYRSYLALVKFRVRYDVEDSWTSH